MALKIRQCLNCGAPLKGFVCEYCDSVHEDDAQEETILYADNHPYLLFTPNEIRKASGLPEVKDSGTALSRFQFGRIKKDENGKISMGT